MYKLYIVTTVLHGDSHISKAGVGTSISVATSSDVIDFHEKYDADLAYTKLCSKNRCHSLNDMRTSQIITKLYD